MKRNLFYNFIYGFSLLFLFPISSCNYRDDKRNFNKPKVQNELNIPPIIFKLYIESSLSMRPYNNITGRNLFHSTIVRLLNNLNSTSTTPQDNIIYIVNDSTYKINQTFSDFITSNDIFSYSNGIGNPNYTDFEKIFRAILRDTRDNELSILVSDMIYSTRQMAGKSNEVIVNEAAGITYNIFNYFKRDYSLLILKLISDFNGNYYIYRTPQSFYYNGNRPYYISFIGEKEVINKILKLDKYNIVRNFDYLPGFQYFYFYNYTENSFEPPFYSILLSDKNTNADFEKPRNDQYNSKGQIISLEEVNIGKHFNFFQLAIAVDLSKVFIDDTYKTTLSNYKISPPNDNVFNVIEVKPIPININQNDKKYLGTATHLIILRAKSLKYLAPMVSISLIKKHPQWISESSTIDDTEQTAKNFSTTTFGFASLMDGIFNAYNPDMYNSKYFSLTLYLKK